MTDIRQSTNYSKYLRSQGWIVESLPAGKAGINNINYFVRKISILGSVLKIQRPKTISTACLSEVKHLEEKYKVFQTIFEPDLTSAIQSSFDHKLIISHGFKLSKSPYLPSKTLHLDLTKPFIFKKETRRSIKIGERAKIVEYSTPKELEIFHNAWRSSVNFSRFVPSLTILINLKKSFPNNYSTFLASHNKTGNIIGGAIFTRSSHDYTYYWYGFTNKEGRTSLSQYSLLYQGILWGKKIGCKIFDFEGIYDDRFPQRSWLGFTHFKKQFGGVEVLYPGCYTKLRFPV